MSFARNIDIAESRARNIRRVGLPAVEVVEVFVVKRGKRCHYLFLSPAQFFLVS